jgi:pimeloyl-ACP methyl ester carboxylesterase
MVKRGRRSAPDTKGLVLLSGYFYPTARADVALASPPAMPVLGDILRYTVSPLVGRVLLPAIIKGMFTPCDVPADFAEHFPLGMSVRPSQIGASSQDAAAMIPAAAAMRHRYRELSMPLVIMAGREDKVSEVGTQSVRLHEEIPPEARRGAGRRARTRTPRRRAWSPGPPERPSRLSG